MPYSFALRERQTQEYWKKHNVPRLLLKKNKNTGNTFVFYDGPPFATGTPHYGHIIGCSIKDSVCRYALMNGKYIYRPAGFDCHGLPIEYEIEKKLGIKTHADVQKYGIREYNNECRQIVLRCEGDWETMLTRFAVSKDLENDYKTMDMSFMNSVWGVGGIIYNRGLMYKGFQIMPYSTACGTPLSNFEAKSNYKEVMEESIVVTFQDAQNKDWNYLVWTTTPWTLPSNMALCVNPNIEYVVVETNGKKYVLAKSLVHENFSVGKGKKKKLPADLKILETFSGSKLQNRRYLPILDYYKKEDTANNYSYTILADEFVLDDSGTGIVHIAPAFGADDFRVCRHHNIIDKRGTGIRCPVDSNGRFTEPINDYVEKNVKDCDKDIIRYLKTKGNLFKRINTTHPYPYCWRSDTPLIYKAVSSWFINVEELKEDLVKNNAKVHWVPDHVGHKRFHNWLENARDWGISRSRYWGTPIPIWTDKEETEFQYVSSVGELEQLAGFEKGSIKDLHRDTVDQITFVSPKTGKTLRRIPDVFDCWFESGSMPFAHQNYPENQDINFPGDFIAEGLDQTRGWFYTLLVISTALKNTSSYKNVVVNGIVLAEDGQKMAKRLKNYPDPIYVIDEYGADPLRLALLGSPATHGESMRFAESTVKEIIKTVMIPFENSYVFFKEQFMKYQTRYGADPDCSIKSSNIYDQWILHKFHLFKEAVFRDFDNYELCGLTKHITGFIEHLNNQYIKLNKFRMKGKETKRDFEESMVTLYKILFNLSILLTPLMPHYSEQLFQQLKNIHKLDVLSVHLLNFTDMISNDTETNNTETNDTVTNDSSVNPELFYAIDQLHQVIDLVRTIRGRHNIPFKKPVKDIIICSKDPETLKKNIQFILDLLKKESNIHLVNFEPIDQYCTLSVTPNKSAIGKSFRKSSKLVMSELASMDDIAVLSQLNKEGTLELGNIGFTLTKEHFNIIYNVKLQKNYHHELNNTGGLLVYLNTEINQKIMEEYHTKLLTTSVQKFRKELNMKSCEKVIVQYDIVNLELLKMVQTYKTKMEKALESQILVNETDKIIPTTDIVGEKTIEIKDHDTVRLVLWRVGKPVTKSSLPEDLSKGMESDLEHNLLNAFQSLDSNKTGFVSTADFQKVIKQFKIHVNRNKLNHLIQLKYEDWIKKTLDK